MLARIFRAITPARRMMLLAAIWPAIVPAAPAVPSADAPGGASAGGGSGADRASPKSVTANIESGAAPAGGLTGDWGGLRTRLVEKAVTIASRYQSEVAYNPRGGDRHTGREAGQFDIGATADLDKLFGLRGGTFKSTATYRRGEDLGAAAGINPLQQVQEIYGRGHTWRLTQFWYEQTLGDHVNLLLGRSAPGEDFAAFSCDFMNLSFCGTAPGNLVGEYWYNWPISQWTARLRISDGDRYVQTAVYEVNPKNLDNRFTLGYLHGATGVLVPAELGWMPRLGAAQLPGFYKIGAWYSNVKADDVFLDVNRQPHVLTGEDPLRRSGRYGGWIDVEQQVTGTAHDGHALSGTTVFLNLTRADRRTSFLDNQIVVGAFFNGLIPSRPKDVLGIGFARTHVNTRAADAQRLAGGERVQRSEYACELFYELRMPPWLTLRPNLQYLHEPGGRRDERDAMVVGLKSAITF